MLKRFVSGLALVCCLLGGCTWHRPSVATLVPPQGHTQVAPKVKSLDGQIADLTGQLKTLQVERDAARLEPLRVSLEWAEGLSLLAILAGVGLAVALRVWAGGVGMWKALGIAVIGAAILATCLGTSKALDHVSWIIGAVCVLGVAGAWWLLHSHVSLTGKAKSLVKQAETIAAQV